MTDAPAFFRAIEADPDDDTPRLVYADWLDENAVGAADRARAELIRVQCAHAHDPDRRGELEPRTEQLLTEQAAWTADWPVPPLTPVYHRGFIDPVALPGAQFGPHADRLVELTPLFHLRLVRARGAMKAVAACPHLARVRRLTLTGAWLRNPDLTDFAPVSHLGNLQHLDVSHNQIGIRGATDLAVTRAPALRALNVSQNPPLKDGGIQAIAQADWLALEHLDASECGLGAAGVIGLVESALPGQLRSLQLSRNPAVTPAAWVRLARAAWARLERLDLSTPSVTDEVVVALAENSGLASLRVLHLGATALTARGAQAILGSPYLRELTRLRLPELHLDTALREQLRARFGAGFNPGRE